ncbi:SGNH/GDSL hydrolase family protein [Cohnella fermenti]|uniref:SGNH hydrolase-type esterase domain-containing protein n=1 Tax=Cohnella fermenti TaxID=2565925 RepID=A0A4S4C646_9BACL|nr:SGNH/GDSL hydrolase family protein [Cohnella fermenti]THF83330.1 hypothetical protein E6C55_05630 [Cohnella fermenti]
MSGSKYENRKLDRALGTDSAIGADWRWVSPGEKPLALTGLPWFRQDGAYRRLPVRPAYPLRPEVDRLANFPTGVQIRLRTDSPKLAVRVELAGPSGAYTMTPAVQCGVDCYLGGPGEQRYVSTSRFDPEASAYESLLFENKGDGMKDITLYLPLYQGVKDIAIGVAPSAELHRFPAFADSRKVIIYGTSIVHGAAASRPGMAYPNMLSRRIPLEFVSLAFSGNARGEKELALLAAEIDHPGLLVLDYEGNVLSFESLVETLPAFIRTYRQAWPEVPILVLSQIRMAKEAFDPELRRERERRLALQRNIVERFRLAGDANVHFQSGKDLLGDDYEECSADSVHPSDLGYRRMSDALLPVFERLLGL